MNYIRSFTLLLSLIVISGAITAQNESASNGNKLEVFHSSLDQELISGYEFTLDENLMINESLITTHSSNVKPIESKVDPNATVPYSIFEVQYNLASTDGLPESTLLPVNLKPNPCKRNIYLITDSSIGGWEVWNSLGNILIQGDGKKVDASSLNEGIYFLKLDDRVLPFIKED